MTNMVGYDHVTPGLADSTGSKGRRRGFNFDQLGPRVPAVVISPLIPKNIIEHRLLEHCSVIKTLMDLFDVPPLEHRAIFIKFAVSCIWRNWASREMTRRQGCPRPSLAPSPRRAVAVFLPWSYQSPIRTA
jgi:hypothetical protein